MIKPAIYLKKTALFVINKLKPGNLGETGNKNLEAESDRLNKLAAKAPFCIIHKARKFDVL